MNETPAANGPHRKRIPTVVLLTCVAIGVAGGALLAPANWLSILIATAVPWASLSIVGLWLLPPVIALRLLQRPLVGILVGFISGLVIVPFSGMGFASVLTNLSWALAAEIAFIAVLWRRWNTWLHYLGAVITTAVYLSLYWGYFNLSALSVGVQIAAVVVTLLSCVVGTALGILIADALRNAGVAQQARRRTPK